MTQASFAEQMLSITMPPDRAASTVGDLLESSPKPFRFWTTVFRTFTSAASHQMSFGATAKALVLIALTLLPLEMIFITTINRVQFPGIWISTTLRLAIFLLVGRIVAGRMPGREMVASITYALALVPLVIVSLNAVPFSSRNNFNVTPILFQLLNVLLGCLLARRNSLKKFSQ